MPSNAEELPFDQPPAEALPEQPAEQVAEVDPGIESEAGPVVWAKNQVELAKLLECERKSIQRWLKEDGNDCPGKRADGRYNVAAWKLWIAKSGRKVRTSSTASKGDLEMEGLRLKNEKMALENMVRNGELMHVDEVCKVLTEMLSAAVQRARQVKHSLAPSVIGLSQPEAIKRIGHEVDEVLNELALGDWAKKKAFWSNVYAHLQSLQAKLSLGDGQSAT